MSPVSSRAPSLQWFPSLNPRKPLLPAPQVRVATATHDASVLSTMQCGGSVIIAAALFSPRLHWAQNKISGPRTHSTCCTWLHNFEPSIQVVMCQTPFVPSLTSMTNTTSPAISSTSARCPHQMLKAFRCCDSYHDLVFESITTPP